MSDAQDQVRLLEILQNGEMTVSGQFMWGSNYTFLCTVAYQGESLQAVYKPVRGERPLWDFPSDTLSGREVAAYLLSEAGGWQMVPPTVYRQEAPAGPGSLQLFIEHDPEYHYFNFIPADKARLRPVALFDIVANNTDRKGGHILIDPQGKVWLIDHGICFHSEPKLRTVVWDFAGQPLTAEEDAQLAGLSAALGEAGVLRAKLGDYLTRREIHAMLRRIQALRQAGIFPVPEPGHYVIPWPPV